MMISAKEWARLAEKKGLALSAVYMEMEEEKSGLTNDQLKERMMERWIIMKEGARKGLLNPLKPLGGIIGGEASKMRAYQVKGTSYCGDSLLMAMAYAFSTAEYNASMGKICAAPTAGSAGILPAALTMAQEKDQLTDEACVRALFTAGGIGEIIAQVATVSGAEGGCQAECGSAAAMAAGALVELAGGRPDMVLHAASIALKNVMGLVCDPIAGLVEAPCSKRNASGVANAMISADIALAGVESIIPFDEVVLAMKAVGDSLDKDLRETGKGGVAATPTGQKIADRIFGRA
jgi:L-serine dehydratase